MMLPKKSLGQHFLTDRNIAAKIAASLSGFGGYTHLLEAGPGMGALTIFLLNETNYTYHGIEIDGEAVKYLKKQHPGAHFVHADLLKCDLGKIAPPPFALIGNFPYNISSQILFKILDNRDDIPEVVGMFQEEVAQRICSAPGSKTYGILSVLTAAFYDVEYLFPVSEKVFRPRPRVQSAVMRLRRNTLNEPDCDPLLFFRLVKAAFNQRRKMLRNALHSFDLPDSHPLLTQRAEHLSVQEFAELTRLAGARPLPKQ